jgi:hypothetical protein
MFVLHFLLGLIATLFLTEGDPPDPEKPKDPPKDPEKPKDPPKEDAPKVFRSFSSQDDLDNFVKDRVQRAKDEADAKAREDEAKKQGDFKKIVDEEYEPLKAKHKEATDELEEYRKEAQREVDDLKAKVPADLLELIDLDGLSLTQQREKLRKAVILADKDKKDDTDESKKPKDGNNPKHPDPKSRLGDDLAKRATAAMQRSGLYHTTGRPG